MLIDIVFPENNEDEFIKIAVKLGYNAICFAYKFDKSKNEKQKELIKEKQKLKIRLLDLRVKKQCRIKLLKMLKKKA